LRLKHAFSLLTLPLLFLVPSCGEEDNSPAAPDPDPQISVVQSWKKSVNAEGRQNGLQSNKVFDMLVTSEGELWVGNSDGIVVFGSITSGARSAAYDHTNGLPNPKVRKIVEHGGLIYVATWGGGTGVFDMATDTWSKLSMPLGPQTADIEVFDDVLYFSTNRGVSILDTDTGTWSTYRKETSSNPTGLLMPDPNELPNPCDGCPLDELVKMTHVANTSRGLERWHARSIEFGIPPTAIPYLGITVLRVSDDLSPVTSRVTYTMANSAIPSPAVMDILFDDATGFFYIATQTDGVARVDVDNAKWTTYGTADGLPSDATYSLVKVNGRIWVATQGGVAGLRENGTWQGYGKSGGLTSDLVRRVYTDDGTRLWVGFTDGGVSLLDPSNADGL
jgi:hypothetical protein